eukprot:1709614-Prymnesium_polylepis.1
MRYTIAVEDASDARSVNVKPANVRELKFAEIDSDVSDAEEQPEAPEGAIPKGATVTIHGLQSEAAKALNGQRGRVNGFSADKGRFDVELEDGQVKAIKLDNLRVADVSVD